MMPHGAGKLQAEWASPQSPRHALPPTSDGWILNTLASRLIISEETEQLWCKQFRGMN
jgi:hypothetical protein